MLDVLILTALVAMIIGPAVLAAVQGARFDDWNS
jgi:hypothetical protein